MAEPLWTGEALVAATGGRLDGALTRAIGGVSIDTRTLQPGDLFVALAAERDGHEFVARRSKPARRRPSSVPISRRQPVPARSSASTIP